MFVPLAASQDKIAALLSRKRLDFVALLWDNVIEANVKGRTQPRSGDRGYKPSCKPTLVAVPAC